MTRVEIITTLIASLAFVFSFYTFWYTRIRRVKPVFACSRWNAIGLTAQNQPGAAFALSIGVANYSNHPLIITDYLLEADTSRKKIYYDPILLFDLNHYIIAFLTNQNAIIAHSQKGQAPIPIIIPAIQQYSFDYELLFMPQDKMTSINTQKDTPFTLRLFVLTDRAATYEEIAAQEIGQQDVANLMNGGFSSVTSTVSIQRRSQFMDQRVKPN